YSAVSGLTFAPAASADTANIVPWLVPQITDSLLGLADTPADRPDGHVWIYFDGTQPEMQKLNAGGEGLWAMTHELGHALGLAHPHDGSGLEPDRSTF